MVTEIQSIPRMKTVAESQHTCSSGEHLGEGETPDPHSQHGTSHADCRVSGSTRRVPGDGQDTASKARADQGMTQDQQGNSTLLSSQRTQELPLPRGETEQDPVVQSLPTTTSTTSCASLPPVEKLVKE